MQAAKGVYSPVLDHLFVILGAETIISFAKATPKSHASHAAFWLLFVCASEEGTEETSSNLHALIGKPKQMNEPDLCRRNDGLFMCNPLRV